MRTPFLLAMALLCSSATAAPVPKELKKRDRIVGLWKLQSATLRGLPSEVGANDTDWMIDENFGLTRSGNYEVAKLSTLPTQLKIDTAPNEIDWPESTFLGRYEIRGDRLTICLNEKGLPRPNTFVPNTQNFVWILRRVEK